MQKKIMLEEKDIPSHYYNILADLPNPLEPDLSSGTKTTRRVRQDLAPFFLMELIKQEVGTERFVPIPGLGTRCVFALSPDAVCIALTKLGRALDTPAHIYYKKYEGVMHPARQAMKLNSCALAQVYYNKEQGVKTSCNGDRQASGEVLWHSHASGSDCECKVYMVKVSYEQKPYRRFHDPIMGR